MKLKPRILAVPRHLATVCLLALGSTVASAAVIADFSGGSGTTQPDQYLGMAGDGWAEAWSSRTGSQSTSSFTVNDSTPFGPDGGNYLQINYQRTATGTGSNRTGVARPFLTTGSSSIDMSKAYTIAFDFRADTLTGWDSSADQIAFSSESTSTIGSFGADTPWSLLIRGDNRWVVTNGNGVGGISNLDFTSLGLTSLTAGTVYSIKVFIDPEAKGYDLTITAGDTTYRASDLNDGNLLGFRTNATAKDANVLQFRSYTSELGTINWSLDNIEIASVPEPSVVGMLIGGLVGMRLLMRSRCR